MPGYLFDTNHFSEWERGNPKLLERIRSKGGQENFIWICPIVRGEIEFGLSIAPIKDRDKQEKCRAFLNDADEFAVQPMDPDTAHHYAVILSKSYELYPKTNPDQSTQEFLSSLGVDINDVWIAAIALTHNLILVTHDDMHVIRKCVPDLRFDDWLA